MAAARIPDKAMGRIALTGQLGMRLEIIKLLISDDIFSITDDFKNYYILAV